MACGLSLWPLVEFGIVCEPAAEGPSRLRRVGRCRVLVGYGLGRARSPVRGTGSVPAVGRDRGGVLTAGSLWSACCWLVSAAQCRRFARSPRRPRPPSSTARKPASPSRRPDSPPRPSPSPATCRRASRSRSRPAAPSSAAPRPPPDKDKTCKIKITASNGIGKKATQILTITIA